MKANTFFLLTALLSHAFLFSYAQEYAFKNYTTKDGLPSSETYHVLQDAKGYIWIGTDMGVARFDGEEFRTFDSSHGIPGSTVFELFEDHSGAIWFYNFSNRLSYFKNDSIYEFRHNNKILPHLREGANVMFKNSFYVDSLNRIYFSMSNSGLLLIDEHGNVSSKYSGYGKTFRYLADYGFEKVFLHADDALPDDSADEFVAFMHEDIENSGGLNVSSKSDDNKIVFASKKKLLIFYDGKIREKEFEHSIIYTKFINNDLLAIGFFYNGAAFYSISKDQVVYSFLPGQSVSSIMQDRSGSFWFSTLNSGVFFLSGLSVLNYLVDNNQINALKSYNNNLYIAQTGGYFYVLDSNGGLKKQYYSEDASEIVYDFLIDDTTFLIGSNRNIYSKTSQGAFKRYSNEAYDKNLSVKRLCKWNEDTLVVGHSYGLNMYTHNKLLYNSVFQDSLFMRVNALLKIGKDSLLIAGQTTVYGFNKKSIHDLSRKYPSLNIRILDMAQLSDSIVLFATKGAGLLMLKGDKMYRFTEKDGLISNFVTRVLLADSNCVWIGSNKGVQQLHIDCSFHKIIDEVRVSGVNGMVSNEVNDLCLVDSSLFVATKHGLSKIDLRTYKRNLQAPKVFIKKILLDNKKAPIDSVLYISPEMKTIGIHYSAISFRNRKDLNYGYLLEGIDDDWIETQSTVLQFTTLPHGEYVLWIKAQNEDGVWSTPLKLKLIVHPKIWQYWWFIVLSCAIVLFVGFSLYRRWLKEYMRKTKMTQDILELKQISLRQQMNPHFIFNTLNSIQLYILEKDTFSSHKYLSFFAKLMRQTLDNSRYSKILLKEELKALEFYLELEMLRFDDKISYEISVSDDDILYYKVPTLIIQPFVENSIWHGLMHKQGKGKIRIDLQEKNNKIICRISDDGVGRQKRTEIEKQQHKSMGTKILNERMELLNSIYKDEFKIMYIDLFDEKNVPSGTIVELTIPIFE